MKQSILLFALLAIAVVSAQDGGFDTSDSGYGCISGDCDNGLGKYVWKNGDYYYGAWKEGKKERKKERKKMGGRSRGKSWAEVR